MKIAAVILCGGKSVRMGRDKGLIKTRNKLWVEIIQNQIPNDCDIFISVGKHNIEDYSSLGLDNLILDQKFEIGLVGAIKGLFSIFIQVKEEYDYFLVTAVDMIKVETIHFQKLINTKSNAVFSIEDKSQPMPFIVHKDDIGEASIYQDKSLKYIINNIWQAKKLNIEDTDFLSNYNFPSEIGI